MAANKNVPVSKTVEKVPTGITGLDEITEGGLPKGRPTLICGTAGVGKSLFGLEFVLKGAKVYNEPGVIVTFEEKPDDLAMNVASLGYDLQKMQDKGAISIDYVRVERSEIEE